ncbi:MAG: hypothetical protein P8L47_02080 [Candidatus Marinamargulisbacteria bacterium]|nr:hypothetical protein [Candidatus Marinamargulisbacteria bacterium]
MILFRYCLYSIRRQCLYLIIISLCGLYAHAGTTTELGGSIYQYYYAEPGVMAINGLLFDINSSLHIENPSNPWATIRAEVRYFLSDDPTYTSKNTGKSYRNYHTGFETRALFGQTLYTGIGYRELIHHGAGTVTSTGHIGYDRLSQYTYIPIGIRLALNNARKKSWTINIEYRNLQRGIQTTSFKKGTKLSIGSGNFYTLPNDKVFKNYQPNGYGIHVAIKTIKHRYHGIVSNRNHFQINAIATTVFFNYWSIEDSNFVPLYQSSSLYEPRNYTTELGITLQLIF